MFYKISNLGWFFTPNNISNFTASLIDRYAWTIMLSFASLLSCALPLTPLDHTRNTVECRSVLQTLM